MILEEARRAFIRAGYENFSMRKLAEKIEYSPGALYLHFKDKDDLVNCLVDEGFARLLEALERIHDERDAVRSLKKKLRAYIDFGLRYPNHYHFAFMMRRAGVSLGHRTVPHPSFDVLRDAVRRCVAQKMFRAEEVETISQMLWATMHGITSLLIVHHGFPWVDRESLIDRMLDMALDGWRRPPGRAASAGGRHGTRRTG